MSSKKIYIQTFGCKVNQYDTASIKSILEQNGHLIVENDKDAELIIINSCTVTAESDNKALQAIRHYKSLNKTVLLTGCFPQGSPENSKNSKADIITGTKERYNIPTLINEYYNNDCKQLIDIKSYNKDDSFETIPCNIIPGHTRAFLKIQDGCNRFCSYCKIPYARGFNRSKPFNILQDEIKSLAENGYSEIVLTGINLAFYNDNKKNLADIAEYCNSIKEIKRLRLGSLEPEMMTDDVLLRLSNISIFCPVFHLSLQSGNDKILKKMNRHYSTDDYYKLVLNIKKYFPNAVFTTDIMTGFPGENDDDFADSINFAKKIGYADIHVFPYSEREGTPAAKMNESVPWEIRKRRCNKLIQVASELRNDFLKSHIGKIYPVLFEKEKKDGYHCGYTEDYILVKILTKSSQKTLRNKFFYVIIESMTENYLIGKILPNENIDTKR